MKPLTLTLLALLIMTGSSWAYQPDPCCDPPSEVVEQVTHSPADDAATVADRSMQKERLRQLAGLWINTHPNLKLESPCGDAPLHIKEAEVRYRFHEDGTFQKVLTSRLDADLRFEETGRWAVSPNGRHLQLFRSTPDGERLLTQASIKYLEHDEMVLSHPVASINERQVLNVDANLFFNKH